MLSIKVKYQIPITRYESMCITFNLFSQKSCGNLLNCLVRSPKTNNVSHVYLNLACFIWAVTIIQYCSFIHRSLSYYTLLLSCQVNAVNIFTVKVLKKNQNNMLAWNLSLSFFMTLKAWPKGGQRGQKSCFDPKKLY